ncbi:hypothetical protein ALP99_102326 [Pseudomonas syringae pv. tomato]|uniref:Uncharacterized protein n=1 Tax=Pseudomonas syringae pv. viburni TaxID=251703 RepID=A0A0N8TDR5_9PSED|nr:hypothetical protein XJ28_21150 [Pseudomonas syringae pv. tomato]EEB59168.1 hypothetical protein PSPTOT1_4290 [Pseudomonas syringae pv. tomato T1]KPZ14329.1 hypothetical protein ALO40_102503 [Pseudomonas syringae pv. viburni]QBI62202.1 hypothetical protein EIZ61_12320 [Pseudomonas syringae]RMQ71270.1 hypothetical protein ALQ00_102226 [Pseudomonas syringae pv. tomato]
MIDPSWSTPQMALDSPQRDLGQCKQPEVSLGVADTAVLIWIRKPRQTGRRCREDELFSLAYRPSQELTHASPGQGVGFHARR